jgi:hypothetical protein
VAPAPLLEHPDEGPSLETPTFCLNLSGIVLFSTYAGKDRFYYNQCMTFMLQRTDMLIKDIHKARKRMQL